MLNNQNIKEAYEAYKVAKKAFPEAFSKLETAILEIANEKENPLTVEKMLELFAEKDAEDITDVEAIRKLTVEERLDLAIDFAKSITEENYKQNSQEVIENLMQVLRYKGSSDEESSTEQKHQKINDTLWSIANRFKDQLSSEERTLLFETL